MRYRWLLCLAMQAPGIVGSLAQVPGLEGRVDEIFSEWNRPDSPGCAVSVVRDGKILLARGYGSADLEHAVAIGPDTVFYIGSVSKQFVAVSVLLLEEQGLLSLDDNIRKFLPELPDYGTPISIRHLLHHTSGIRDYLELWDMSGRDYLDRMSAEEVYELICRQKELNFQPGERHLYSNSCYFLIPLIVERVTGKSFQEFTRLNIFEPLEMRDSHFHDDVGHIVRNRAFSYSGSREKGFENLIMRFALVGSGGLYTTVRDLFRWDQNFYSNRLGLARAELLDKMHENGRLNDGSEIDYAIALVNGKYRGLRTVQHSGSLAGYRAQLLRFPEERFSVIVLANLGTIDASSLAYQVADLYLADELAKREEPGASAPEREAAEVDPSVYDRYEGRYQLEGGLLLSVRRQGDRLLAALTGQSTVELVPASGSEFFLRVAPVEVHFEQAEDGVYSLILHQGGRAVLGRRLPAVSRTPEELAEYAGVYHSDELSVEYQVLAKGEKLSYRVGYSPVRNLDWVEGDTFSGPLRVTFERDPSGIVTALKLDSGRVKNIRLQRRSSRHMGTRP